MTLQQIPPYLKSHFLLLRSFNLQAFLRFQMLYYTNHLHNQFLIISPVTSFRSTAYPFFNTLTVFLTSSCIWIVFIPWYITRFIPPKHIIIHLLLHPRVKEFIKVFPHLLSTLPKLTYKFSCLFFMLDESSLPSFLSVFTYFQKNFRFSTSSLSIFLLNILLAFFSLSATNCFRLLFTFYYAFIKSSLVPYL